MDESKAAGRRKRRVDLYLIRPSNYDDDGYVVTYVRGVLPSNTLNCLAALTREVVERKQLPADVALRVHLLDETVQRIPLSRIARRTLRGGRSAIVCLAGVQTNQFPRAADLARNFRRSGITVLIGGFHVSGALAMADQVPHDIQSLLDAGVTIVKGEVEDYWADLLNDAIEGRLQPLYDFLNRSPELRDRPIPLVDRRLMKRFVASNHGTIDCGRGCPYRCSFCTVINVQGRTMRVRSVGAIAAALRENWYRFKVNFYFFTDDNFARNPEWDGIFEALIALREKEGIDLHFMMQVDALSHKIPGFIEKARRAGCTQVFIGMESVNPANLKDAAKTQNKTIDYVNLIRAWREAEVATHVGYILGFSHDTSESVHRDLQTLIHEIQVEQASFFILTPLPGSQDHRTLLRRGDWLDPDLNKYDSMHEVMAYPGFAEPGQLLRIYQEAYETFYSFENMRQILQRTAPRNYWNIFKNFLWYKHSALLERRHPMMAGFIRRKSRRTVRPGMATPGWWAFWAMRVAELRDYGKGLVRLLWEMQELWLQTRPRSPAEQALLEEMQRIYVSVQRRLTVAELQMACKQARSHLPALKVPSRVSLYWQKWGLFCSKRWLFTRADIDRNWRLIRERVRGHRFLAISPRRLAVTAWLDFQVTTLFFVAFVAACRK
ncbi:MAG: radical SAM protein [Acidobacteriota bacterium]